MPSFFRTPHNRHITSQYRDYEHARVNFERQIKALPERGQTAQSIALALDQRSGDTDQRFFGAIPFLIETLIDHYENLGQRRPHLLANLIKDNKDSILDLYRRVARTAIQDHYQYDFAAALRRDLLASKGTEQAQLYKEMMAAFEADMSKSINLLDDYGRVRTSDQVKDAIQEHFQTRGIAIYDIEVSHIKHQTHAFLQSEFENFYRQRQCARQAHLREHISEVEPIHSGPTPPAKTVKFNPRVIVYMYQDPAFFSANEFTRRQLAQRGRSFIFNVATPPESSAVQPRLRRRSSFPN